MLHSAVESILLKKTKHRFFAVLENKYLYKV